MAVNITQKGTELGGFLDATGEPLGDFIFDVGIAVALLGVVLAVVYLIRKKINIPSK